MSGKKALAERAGRKEGKREVWVYLTFDPKDDTLTVETSWLPASVGRKLSAAGFEEQGDGTWAARLQGAAHRDELGVLRVITKAYAVVLGEM